MAKKKILIFIDWYLPGYKAGGPVQSVANLVENLKDNDNKIVYSSAESLYNLLKYINNEIILYFDSLFEGLLLIKVNQDEEVKLISENFDSFLKESINLLFFTKYSSLEIKPLSFNSNNSSNTVLFSIIIA